MTAADRHSLQALRPLVLRARRAPSVHNTQPWRFVLEPTRLAILADRTRQLHVLDPAGRQLMISCGCALLNARVAAAAGGIRADVARLPDGADPDLVAILTLGAGAGAAEEDERVLARLDSVVQSRGTNRRRFSDEPVPDEVVAGLRAAAEAHGARLVQISSEADRGLVAELTQLADQAQARDPSYRAELRAWTTDDPLRLDGVPAIAVPHFDAGSGDEIPIRDFDTRGTGYLPTQTASTRDQCLLLLGTDGEDPLSWLRAGEALERVLLEIAAQGLAASPFTQVIEVPAARQQLRLGLNLTMYPHLLLRIGKAQPTAGTPRRHLDEMLVEKGGESVRGSELKIVAGPGSATSGRRQGQTARRTDSAGS